MTRGARLTILAGILWVLVFGGMAVTLARCLQ